jgi:hypothetical protein
MGHDVREADVAIARAPTPPIGQMWAELLGAHGISCRLVPVNAGESVYVPSQGEVEVRVRGIDAQRAQELLPHESRTELADEPSQADEGDGVPDAPTDRGLRWAVLIGIALVVILVIAIAVSRSAANGYL